MILPKYLNTFQTVQTSDSIDAPNNFKKGDRHMHGRSLLLIVGFLLFSGCSKQEERPQHNHVLDNNHPLAMPHVEASTISGSDHVVVDKLPDPEHPQEYLQEHPVMPTEKIEEARGNEKKQKKDRKYRREKEQNNNNDTGPSKTIDFEVENKTGKTIFVTCFSYVKRRDFSRWRWEKSDVYRIKDDDHAIIRMDKIEDPQDRRNVQGYLAVFNNEQEAQDSTYELLKEENQIDLDEISKLHGKKVVITVEKYGMRGEYLEYDFVDKNEVARKYPSLDFPVENRTGKTLFVTCFVYEKRAKGRWLVAVEDKDDDAIWRYEKTNIVKILPNQQKMIHVDTIAVKRDRDALEGYLAIFDEDEEQMAQDSIYELLDSSRKLNLGVLSRLENKKVVLDIEKYGIEGDLIDFTIKPVRKINFTKIIK